MLNSLRNIRIFVNNYKNIIYKLKIYCIFTLSIRHTIKLFIMQYTKELNLTNFNFWSGAEQHEFTYSELEFLEDCISDLYPTTPPSETDINDLFWFEEEFLCECIGLDFEEYENR